MPSVEEYRRLNTRKASVLQIGGFRPTFDPLAPNFGATPVAAPGETWPEAAGKPLLFVCQLNLASAPAVPQILSDIKLVTFFANADDAGTLGQENGENWVLRAYKSLDGLTQLTAPAGAPKVRKGFECLWQEMEDHPEPEDPELVPVPGTRRPRSNFENLVRTKVGGYASCLQSEPWWGHTKHAADPKFCIQINSEEKPGLLWGDGGTVYLARGSAPGCEDQWFLDWQSL